MEVRPISHQPGYFVGDDGKVYSEKYGRRVELKQSEYKGYRHVALSKDNKRQIYPAHRLVAEAFVPNPDEKSSVNHKDGSKRNDSPLNLEWCTRAETQKHSREVLGNTGRGAKNSHFGYRYAKLYPNEELRNRLVETRDCLAPVIISPGWERCCRGASASRKTKRGMNGAWL